MNILVLFKGYHPSLSGTDHMAIQTSIYLQQLFSYNMYVAHASKIFRYKKYQKDGVDFEIIPPDVKGAIEALRNKDFNLIHLFDCTDRTFLQVAYTLAQLKNIPLVITPATDVNLWEDLELGISICKEADYLFALSKKEKDIILSLGAARKDRIIVIPHFPYISTPAENNWLEDKRIDLKDPLVIFIGRKVRTKGYNLILQATEKVWKKHPQTTFVFAGPPTMEYVTDRGMYQQHPRIVDVGEITESEKSFMLEHSDIICLPSTNDVYPLVFLEAWYYGKPVIGTPIFKDDVIQDGKDGLIVEANHEKVAEGIIRLLDDPQLRSELGRNGRLKVMSEHSWEASVKKLNEIYNQVLDSYQS